MSKTLSSALDGQMLQTRFWIYQLYHDGWI